MSMSNDNKDLHSNDNSSLLAWAVENITEWNDDYTHLRSDKSQITLLYTKGTRWIVDCFNEWIWEDYTCAIDHYEDLGELRFCTPYPQVITKQEWLNAKASKDTPTTSPEATQELSNAKAGHIHAELMAEYALVAKTNPKPWKEFEFNEDYQGWLPMIRSPKWAESVKYRRKPIPPKTMNIGGIVVEAWPLDHLPPYGSSYWTIVLDGTDSKFISQKYTNQILKYDENVSYSGKAFSTKEQAQAVANALNTVYNRAIGRE